MRPRRFAPKGTPSMTQPWTSVPERFQAVALAQADRPAVVQNGGRAVTYAQLRRAAAQLGAGLAAHGVGAKEVVGLCLEKSPEYVAALLGVWWAGGAFLPLTRTGRRTVSPSWSATPGCAGWSRPGKVWRRFVR